MKNKKDSKTIEIRASGGSDVIIMADKIQFVLEKKGGCIIGFDNGSTLTSGASFDDVKNAICMFNKR